MFGNNNFAGAYGAPTYFNTVNRGAIQWVNGIEGAKAYSVYPNSSVLLMDSSLPRFYIKNADSNGMCSIKEYEFKEVSSQAPVAAAQPDLSAYVTHDELNKIIDSLTGGKQSNV